MSTTKISRGEVYYIKPRNDTVGSEQRSGRPAVIVSNNTNNEFSPVVEICFLTLQEKHKLPTHIFIDRGVCDNSTVLCEQVTSISKERLGDYMCTLPDDIMDDVDRALVVSLGLDYIIEQDAKKYAPARVPNPAYEVIPDSTLEELDKLRVDVNSLEERNKELDKGLTSALDTVIKKSEEAEKAKQEAKLYKKMYDNLLDKVLGNK